MKERLNGLMKRGGDLFAQIAGASILLLGAIGGGYMLFYLGKIVLWLVMGWTAPAGGPPSSSMDYWPQ